MLFPIMPDSMLSGGTEKYSRNTVVVWGGNTEIRKYSAVRMFMASAGAERYFERYQFL